jgi:hypothetical protein
MLLGTAGRREHVDRAAVGDRRGVCAAAAAVPRARPAAAGRGEGHLPRDHARHPRLFAAVVRGAWKPTYTLTRSCANRVFK